MEGLIFFNWMTMVSMKIKNIWQEKISKGPKWLWGFWALWFVLFWIPPAVWSDNDLMETKVPEALNPAFEHLLALTGSGGTTGFQPEIVQGLLDFVAAPKEADRLYYVDGVSKGTSAYHEFVVDTGMAHTLKLSYNPAFPSIITSPSSVRLSYWSEFGDGRQTLPKLWDYLEDVSEPFIVTGRETTENTPDTNTGAYYRYGLDRTLILMKHNGHHVLISLSKQTDVSEVGKKGVILGDDTDWTYLYSDKKGLDKAGLGWVSSYMYDSFSIIVYYEMQQGETARVKCGAFKWLDAGWNKINMVKKHHIYKGLERFGQTYKSIVEHPSLRDPAVMEGGFSRIAAMEMGELQQLNRSYLKSVRERHADDKALSSRWVDDLLKDEQVEKMDRYELSSVLMLEYFKNVLGKTHHLDLAMQGAVSHKP